MISYCNIAKRMAASLNNEPARHVMSIFPTFTTHTCLPKHLGYIRSIFAFTLIFSLVHTAGASPIPSNLTDWLRGQFEPSTGKTLSGEIKCYNLPYGGIGFLSHILTYYTVTCLVSGKAPLLPKPGKDLKTGGADVILSALGMIGSVVVSGFNISACRFRWQFVCIGVWKLMLSFALCSISCHQSLLLWAHSSLYPDLRFNFNRESKAHWWLVVYGVGTFVGMTGLLSLVSQKFYEQLSIRIITGIFASLAAVIPAIPIGHLMVTGLVRLWLCVLQLLRIADRSDIIGFHWYIPSKHKWGFWKERAVNDLSFGFGIAAIVFGLLGAFYCDWILAAIAGNWGGFPSSDIAVLYWTYFAAKRLPMLST